MRLYTKISWWENKKRLQLLHEFREEVVTYFNNSEYSWQAEGMIENDNAKQARTKINRVMHEIHAIIKLARVNPVVTSTPPPAIGGYVKQVDVILNIFNLQPYQVSSDVILDHIDRAIGVYESNIGRSLRRTLNPFFWLGLTLDYIVEVPFFLLGKVGFNRKKIEDSLIGRLVKTVFYLLSSLFYFLAILQLTGYLEKFNHFLRQYY